MAGEGHLVVLEGPDGVGKTAIATALATRLREMGLPVDQLSLPGRLPGSLGNHIYDLHHQPQRFGVERIDPTALQVLHAAAHIDMIGRHVKPALKAGRWVVLDRFWWSTIVYGHTMGACSQTLQVLEDLAIYHWRDVQPTALFAICRSGKADEQAQNQQLAEQYARMAGRTWPFRVERVANDGTIAKAMENLLQVLRTYLPVGDAACAPRRHQQAPHVSTPHIWRRHDPVKPTPVFDSLWRLAAERQAILFRRLKGQPPPWTADPVLQQYRFTNAYRAADRVSQYLIRNVIYNRQWPPRDLVLRTLLFKVFNKIETWKRLEGRCGPVCEHDFDQKQYSRALDDLREQGIAIYSAAYIMASGKSAFGHDSKHRNHLAMLQRMLEDRLPEKIAEATSLAVVYELLRGYPSIGAFLAFQYAIDLNYSDLVNFNEMSFVVPGPGARDGIAKCFYDLGGLTETEIIKWTTERQAVEFERLSLAFRDLGGRPLQLIDVQNLFCEVDKYARVHHPEFAGRTGRHKIKQHFRAKSEPLTLWFPPKWGINQHFERYNSREASDGTLFGSVGQ